MLFHGIFGFIIPLRFFKEQMKCHVSAFICFTCATPNVLPWRRREKTTGWGTNCARLGWVSTSLLHPLTGPYISPNVSLFKTLRSCAQLSLGMMKISRALCNRDSKLWDNDLHHRRGRLAVAKRHKGKMAVWPAPAMSTQENSHLGSTV